MKDKKQLKEHYTCVRMDEQEYKLFKEYCKDKGGNKSENIRNIIRQILCEEGYC